MNRYPDEPGVLNIGGPDDCGVRLAPMRKGSTFRRRLNVDGLDLTGIGVRASVRRNYGDPAPVLFMSTDNGKITTGVENGMHYIEFNVMPATTETLEGKRGMGLKHHWDLELVDGADVWPLLKGLWFITDEVTEES